MQKKVYRISIIIAVIGIISVLTGATYAFFNYVRSGDNNIVAVGRIAFSSTQTDTISLTNAFPITSNELETDTDNHDSMEIEITGDTTYSDGVEYLISFSSVNNTVDDKEVPIAFVASVVDIGDSDNDYFENRGGEDSIYKLTTSGYVENDKQVLVGYIASGETGIDGSIEITAYLDADKILISDTYGTSGSNEQANDKEVFTTSEWSSIKDNPISFKVTVEANKGIWVKGPTPNYCFSTSYIATATFNDLSGDSEAFNDCVSFVTGWGFRTGETAEAYCLGTGTQYGGTFQHNLDFGSAYSLEDLLWLQDHNIVSNVEESLVIDDYLYAEKAYTLNDLSNDASLLNKCVNILTDIIGPEEENNTVDVGETYEDFCLGTGTIWGDIFQDELNSDDNFWVLDNYDLFEEENIISSQIIGGSASCGNDVVIPSKLSLIDQVTLNDLSGQDNIDLLNTCVSYFTNLFANDDSVFWGTLDNGSTVETYCLGTGTASGNTLQDILDYYTTSDDIVAYLKDNNIVSIEYATQEYPVSKIGESSFSSGVVGGDSYGGGHITSVIISDGVREISKDAFAGNKISNVVLPSSITTIGKNSFYSNELTSIKIPNGVLEIGSSAFHFNKLTSVFIPSSVTSIGNSAFAKDNRSNPNLQSITIDKSCSVIQNMEYYPWLHYNFPYYNSVITVYGVGGEVCSLPESS